MIASLMMYRRPELDGALSRLWGLMRINLASFGIQSPAELSQDADEWHVWRHPDLVLSQTCGMPYRVALRNVVELIGALDFDVIGCPPGYYRSVIVVSADDSRHTIGEYSDARFAFNQSHSQSGYGAAYWHISPNGFWFDRQFETGSHLASAQAVLEGRADICCIDAVSWRLMDKYDSFVPQLKVIDWTVPTPGHPLISAKGADVPAMFEAARLSIAQLSSADRTALGLVGLVPIDPEAYLAVEDPPGTNEHGWAATA